MKDPKSDYRGVSWSSMYRRWTSSYTHQGKRHNMGLYETEEEAYEAYLKATSFRSKRFPPIVNLPNEEWAAIPDHVGSYEVSNMGRVKTLNFSRTGYEALLKLIDPGTGYYRVCLSQKNRSVHRLVWEAFRSEIPSSMCINHMDRDTFNNKLDNLEMVTYRENSHHHMIARGWFSNGVKQRTNNGKWMSRVSIDNKSVSLGDYDTQQEAESAYWAVANADIERKSNT